MLLVLVLVVVKNYDVLNKKITYDYETSNLKDALRPKYLALTAILS